jgi:hypothetical protein
MQRWSHSFLGGVLQIPGTDIGHLNTKSLIRLDVAEYRIFVARIHTVLLTCAMASNTICGADSDYIFSPPPQTQTADLELDQLNIRHNKPGTTPLS